MTVSQNLIENVNDIKTTLNEISVYNLDVKTAIELYYELAKKVNEVINELSRFEGVVSDEVIKQNEKLIYLLGEGLKVQVGLKIDELIKDGTIQDLINNKIFNDLNNKIDTFKQEVNEQFNTNEKKINNFSYDNKDIKLTGQGALTDVNMLMQKNFSNNKREFAFGVEINGNGSTGSLVTQDDMGHKVALYGSARTGTTGSPFIWSLNTLAQADDGLEGNAIVQGYELDVNNNQADKYSEFDWTKGLILGLNITSGGTYPITAGMRIGGTNVFNLPVYSIFLEGSQDTAIHIQGNNAKGIDMRKAELSTGYALVINEDHKIAVYDSSDSSYNTVMRFLDNYTIINTQGNGFMITTKDETAMLFEVREDGVVNVPKTFNAEYIYAPRINTGQGELRPVLSGDSSQMPTNPLIGQIYFDITRGIPLFWNGVGWVKTDGNLPS